MKIALVMKYYSTRRGGGEWDLVRLSRTMADRGHEVHLFIHGWDDEPDPRLKIHRVPMQTWYSAGKILSFPHYYRKTCRREDFDIVHAMTQVWPADIFWNGGGLFRTWFPTRYPSPLGQWLGLANPKHLANFWVERNIFKQENYRRIVLLSPNDQACLQECYQVPQQAIRLIPNGVNPELFNPGLCAQLRAPKRAQLQLAPECRLLVMVGSDWRRKGLASLLQALERMRTIWTKLPPWKLAVVGQDRPDHWRRLAASLGLAEKVLFPGRASNVAQWYAAADVVVLASHYDGYGNVVPEALACGVPVLSSNRTGAAHLIRPGETGWVVNFDLPHPETVARDYAEILSEVVTTIDLEQMGLQAAQSVSQLTWDWTVDRLEEVYREVLAEKGGM